MSAFKSLSKDKQQKLILTVILALIALGLVINFHLLKRVSELSEQNKTIAELTTQIEQAQAGVKEEVNSTVLRDQMKAFIEGQKQRMVQGDSYSWIVREFTLFAEKHPVHVSSARPGVAGPHPLKPNLQLYTTRLEAEGTYDQLGLFVSDLENSFPTSLIRRLSLVVTDQVKGRCRADIELSLLMRPPEPENKHESKPTAGGGSDKKTGA